MKLYYILVLAFLATISTSNAQEISDTKFGKGLINFVAKDSSFSIKFAPRIQFRANSAWFHDGDKYSDQVENFLIRRARLKFSGFAYSPKLKYKIELGLSNRDIAGANEFNNNTPNYILDAVIMWNFYENFELWVGQTKLPGNIERVVSSANLQLIDRSILNSKFNIDRDIGFQVRHHINLNDRFVVREKFAFSQGEGRNVVTGNLGGHQYTGRLEFLPFGLFQSKGDYKQGDLKREPKPKLMIGATYNFNNDAVRTRSGKGSYMITENGYHQTDITTIFVDGMFKYKGLSFMGEYANREANTPIAVEDDGTPTGDVVLEGDSFNFQGSYLLKNNYEFTGRYSKISYYEVTNAGNIDQYTMGISKYIVGHKLKVQTDFTYSEKNSEKDFIMWRLGFDLHF
ncbi:MAG: OprO/OprP family phosphate-selective porin [Flavobacteriaceae bacterium]|nr:OprO/OprP family phosphate-selective porin [Flavobacteriaceae bacterium]